MTIVIPGFLLWLIIGILIISAVNNILKIINFILKRKIDRNKKKVIKELQNEGRGF